MRVNRFLHIRKKLIRRFQKKRQYQLELFAFQLFMVYAKATFLTASLHEQLKILPILMFYLYQIYFTIKLVEMLNKEHRFLMDSVRKLKRDLRIVVDVRSCYQALIF
jgi:hypothetical protein